MVDNAEQKHREKMKKLKMQKESLKKAAKRGKIVSKVSKDKLIIATTKDGRPIPRFKPKPIKEKS